MKSTIQHLIEEGLHDIALTYGPLGRTPLQYHNQEHADDVMTAIAQMGSDAVINDKITSEQLELLLLAACYHDYVHNQTDGSNEQASADYITRKLQASGEFDDRAISYVTEAILATRFHADEGHFIQAVTHDYSTKLIADADLASVGRPFEIFWDRSLKLKAEHNDQSSEQDFIRTQLTYLNSHQYNTDEAKLYFPHKAANIERLQAMLTT